MKSSIILTEANCQVTLRNASLPSPCPHSLSSLSLLSSLCIHPHISTKYHSIDGSSCPSLLLRSVSFSLSTKASLLSLSNLTSSSVMRMLVIRGLRVRPCCCKEQVIAGTPNGPRNNSNTESHRGGTTTVDYSHLCKCLLNIGVRGHGGESVLSLEKPAIRHVTRSIAAKDTHRE